jgi:beta-lactamase class A
MMKDKTKDQRSHTTRIAATAPVVLSLATSLSGCDTAPSPSLHELRTDVEAMIQASGAEVAVYYQDLDGTASLSINPDVRMHAASTMKVPVMIQLFLDRDAGLLSLEDSLEVVTTFSSIVDGSPYSLTPDSDSDASLYELEGQRVGYRHLMELMITISSNLATNILIQEARAERVTATMRSLGADSIQVLRGVEDTPAFEAGLSNTTTARDLGIIMSALGRREIGSPESAQEMLDIMARQHWREKIPALLPEGTRVAHKTGSITGINHDAGIVYPEGASPFVLVILTRGFQEREAAEAAMAGIARRIYDFHVAGEQS